MQAFAIQQPKAWLVVNGVKRIENREYNTRHRGFVLIHASMRVDNKQFTGYKTTFKYVAYPKNLGDYSFLEKMPHKTKLETCRIIGYATLVDVVTRSDDPWFRGPYGFVFEDAHPLPSIPFVPQTSISRFFPVPETIEQQVLAYLATEQERKSA